MRYLKLLLKHKGEVTQEKSIPSDRTEFAALLDEIGTGGRSRN